MEDKEKIEIITPKKPFLCGSLVSKKEEFFDMKEKLVDAGYTNIQLPAKLDEAFEKEEWYLNLARDLQTLQQCDTIIFLDNFKNDKQALLIYLWGSALGYPMFSEDGHKLEKDNRYLPKAKKLVEGNRAKSYGPPYFDFQRSAKMGALFFNFKDLSPLFVPMFLCLVKISREYNSPKEDNLIDFCGYLLCYKKTLNSMSALAKVKSGEIPLSIEGKAVTVAENAT